VVNSAHPEDTACLPKINEDVKDALNMMGYNVWKQACERAARLSHQPRMESGSKVEVSR
jgi:hypothetical protein